MNRIEHKLAMEFFRSEIKFLARRLNTNKQAHRLNQSSISKGQSPVAIYDTSGEKYWYSVTGAIRNDKTRITALHIIYAEIRGKVHVNEEKKKEYVKNIEIYRKRMEEYIKEKQDSLISSSTTNAGGI
jgi:hypothetical protein